MKNMVCEYCEDSLCFTLRSIGKRTHGTGLDRPGRLANVFSGSLFSFFISVFAGQQVRDVYFPILTLFFKKCNSCYCLVEALILSK